MTAETGQLSSKSSFRARQAESAAKLGKGLGEAIRGFKDSLKTGEATPPVQPPGATALPDTKSPTVPPEQPKN
jgi:hypothetical protein